MFKLSVINDEVSQDLERVVLFAKEFDLDGIELRSVWNKNVSQLSNSEVKAIKGRLDGEGLGIPCVAPPFFKCPIDSSMKVQDHLEILRKSIEVAGKLDCKLVRGFTFFKEGRSYEEMEPKVLGRFDEVLKILESAPEFILGIENESITAVGTGRQQGAFLKKLNSPQVRGIWDPGNVVFVEDVDETPYPDGYEAAKEYMVHFHLKDARKDPATGKAQWTVVGEGEIDYRGQFKAVARDGFSGHISLETHWRPKELPRELVDKPGGSAYSEGGEIGSRICMESLLKILSELGLR